METVYQLFHQGIAEQNGNLVAASITPVPPAHDGGYLYSFFRSSTTFSIETDVRRAIISGSRNHFNKHEGSAWQEVFRTYWVVVGEILIAEEAQNQCRPADWSRVYDRWKDVVNALIKGYSQQQNFPGFTIPCLYVASKYSRIFAIKADEQASNSDGNVTFNGGFQDDVVGGIGKNEKLEDAARLINRIFSICISDRAPLDDSRKWGLYYITNLLFKTYFKLGSISLCKNLVRSLGATKTDMPDFDVFPASHRVTYKYYLGVLNFLEEDYRQAEEHLTEALHNCHKDAKRNRELILTYLIPCHLLTTHTLPTQALLTPYPRLQRLFLPLGACIKRGDLAGFDQALISGEHEFVKRRIYLTLERGRDIALRNLLRKVFIAGGFEPLKEGETEDKRVRRTRIPIKEFAVAVKFALRGEELESEEVECLIANLIYKNLMKGYISRERGTVVLSKTGAFPGTGV